MLIPMLPGVPPSQPCSAWRLSGPSPVEFRVSVQIGVLGQTHPLTPLLPPGPLPALLSAPLWWVAWVTCVVLMTSVQCRP